MLLVLPTSINAFISLGKHDPPYPSPGYKNSLPILLSLDIIFLTLPISAPTSSHKFAISFIKDILVASIEFEAYFDTSEDLISTNTILSSFLIKGSYRSLKICSDFFDSTPTTILSGNIKSFTADPSFKNSGLEATSKSTSVISEIIFLIRCVVPTGTVLFVTITL